MPRTKSSISAQEVRKLAAVAFPRMSSQFFSTSQLIAALQTGELPDGRKATGSLPDTSLFASTPKPTLTPRPKPVKQVQEDKPIVTPTPTPTPTPAPSTKPASDTATELYNAIQRIAGQNIDAETVRAIVREEIGRTTERHTVTICLNGIDCDTTQTHVNFLYLLALCEAKSAEGNRLVNPLLIGPAGSGKTTAAKQVADLLKLEYGHLAFDEETSPSRLLGFIDAVSGYKRTNFRDIYENGGVYLLDEIDRANPNCLTIFNAALANGYCSFPDGELVQRHRDCILIAGANTHGKGADHNYVAANHLDASTTDRFFNLGWDYDWTLFHAMCDVRGERKVHQLCKSGHTPASWFKLVKGVAEGIKGTGVRHVVSPRAIIAGLPLLDVLPREILEEGLIWKGLPEIQRQQLRNTL